MRALCHTDYAKPARLPCMWMSRIRHEDLVAGGGLNIMDFAL